MLEIRLAEAGGVQDRDALARDIFDERFLIRRPLLQALEPDVTGPAVLLIDEAGPHRRAVRGPSCLRCCPTSR